MRCPQCGSPDYGRVKHGADPVDRDGITFRARECRKCQHIFTSGELAITDEFEPVKRLNFVLKALMDESDARSVVEEESDDSSSEEAFFVDDELEAIIAEAEQIAREDYERALATQRALDEERGR